MMVFRVQLYEVFNGQLCSEDDEADLRVSDGKVCSSCGVQFGQVEEQRQHFKLDWHRYNIKRKLQSKATVSEEQVDSQKKKDFK
jgi:hypothetical protein